MPRDHASAHIPTRSSGLRFVRVCCALAYPFVVHLELRAEHTTWTLWVLGGMLLVLLWGAHHSVVGAIACIAGIVAFVAAMVEHSDALLFGPALANVGFALVFGGSLFRRVSIIEAFARLVDPDLSPEKVRYCRRVCWVWTCLFVMHASVIVVLAEWATLTWWTLYTGVLAYLLSGLVGAGELMLRVNRFGWESAGPISRMLHASIQKQPFGKSRGSPP